MSHEKKQEEYDRLSRLIDEGDLTIAQRFLDEARHRGKWHDVHRAASLLVGKVVWLIEIKGEPNQGRPFEQRCLHIQKSLTALMKGSTGIFGAHVNDLKITVTPRPHFIEIVDEKREEVSQLLGITTVRECLDCQALMTGGTTRCVHCVRYLEAQELKARRDKAIITSMAALRTESENFDKEMEELEDGDPNQFCICPRECDCQQPVWNQGGIRGISNYCPVHNERPDIDDRCQAPQHWDGR